MTLNNEDFVDLEFRPLPTNISHPHKKRNIEDAVNPQEKAVEKDSAPTPEATLIPRRPNPQNGWEPLPPFLQAQMIKATMKQLKKLKNSRQVLLDLEYWENNTRVMLSQQDPYQPLIISAQAGSGKSTWIQAFHLALKELFGEKSRLETSLVGTVIVLQKVADLNRLAEALNEGCPNDKPFMVALQGWSASGKANGYCENLAVTSYDQCQRNKCPYASHCQILKFHEMAPAAPVVGLTQERFYMLRGNILDQVLYRQFENGKASLPRRYIIFDEKFKMSSSTSVSTDEINNLSSAFTELLQDEQTTDNSVRMLQNSLSFNVFSVFQALRKESREKYRDSPYEREQDIPIGFVTLPDSLKSRVDDYPAFRQQVMSKKVNVNPVLLHRVLTVMDKVYAGEPVLFTRGGAFALHVFQPPQVQFGDCQTIIFDATAEVDHDYMPFQDACFLTERPKSKPRRITYYLYRHELLKVSKSAMHSSWKLPALTQLLADIIQARPVPAFICTYQAYAVTLAKLLQETLSEAEQKKVLLMPERKEATLPYYFGTNGDNSYREAETVILLGYPRLNPGNYITAAGAAYGEDILKRDIVALSPEALLSPVFSIWSLPCVKEYITHHLAARLEQEIYRSAQRNPGYTGELHIHLFCPPDDVMEILTERIPGEIVEIEDCPDYVLEAKLRSYRFKGKSTSRTRLLDFLEQWNREPVTASDIRGRLGISTAVWKDLISDETIQKKMDAMGIECVRDGRNTIWKPKAA